MAFIAGCLLIDAPASALNNSGEPIQGARTQNTVSVKLLRAADGLQYPYVSSQAGRAWIRATLEQADDLGWQASPTYRGDKVAFSDANPLRYWDDDLFGYMRAPAKADHENIKKTRKDMTAQEENNKGEPRAITRVSPFRLSTLVSLHSGAPEEDFGTMVRADGDPVPYEHQFYRTHLHGLFALEMRAAGVFTYLRRSGFQNLDTVRREEAEQQRLTHDEASNSYRLPLEERTRRIAALLRALPRLQGGAKQAVHYTDVSPAAAIFAVVKGGNNPFNYIFTSEDGKLSFNADVMQDALADAQKHGLLLSPVCIGWKPGFQPQLRASAQTVQAEGVEVILDTPMTVFNAMADHIVANPTLLDQ